MKNFDSRTYSINDFLEWHNNKQLELSPKFQRKSVWKDSARSYLMDTIVRGKPIPKVFIRQKINSTTRKSMREVVDGQQRLRTILSYISDGFQISRRHNSEYGGQYFSQLDDDVQSAILNYEVSVDLLVNMPDEEVLDVFARLNSYAVTLNTQEKLHANHFGPFKQVSERIAHKYNSFWIDNKIISANNILRMEDTYFVSDLIIAMVSGIDTKKSIPKYYDKFEDNFEYDIDIIEEEFDCVMSLISEIYNEGLTNSNFKRIHVFYSLFTALYHICYGITGIDELQSEVDINDIIKIRSALEKIDYLFEEEEIRNLTKKEEQFIADSRRATTDKSVRERRTKYIVEIIESMWS